MRQERLQPSTGHRFSLQHVEQWWFDGDRVAALQVLLSRSGHPATRADWDRQLVAIDENWTEIQSVFRKRVMSVISPGPVFTSNDERFRRIKLGCQSLGTSNLRTCRTARHAVRVMICVAWPRR